MQSRQKAVETGVDQLAGGADAPVRDDYSGNFAVVRTKLIGAGGTRYIEFVRGLKPNYRVVYRDIAVGYVCLLMSLLLTELLIHLGVSVWLMVPVGAILIGYWFAYLQLFIHEGAHYGLAPDKEHSDRLCDLLISVMIGTSVAAYRPIHFQHHRNLGTVQDSEFTYFFPLNLLFVVKGMFGIRAIEVILSREARSQPSNGTGFATGALVRIAAGAALHVVVVGTLVLLGFWAAALAWIVGVALVFPFFGALRQLLEHRDNDADGHKDYAMQDHGAFTRLFKGGIFANTFGGAGFNRHLLHHWEPQVSYTNLPELEAFLETTAMRHIMQQRRTTYRETFCRLFSIH